MEDIIDAAAKRVVSSGPPRGSFPNEPMLLQRFAPLLMAGGLTEPPSIQELASGSNVNVSTMQRIDIQSTMNANLAPRHGILPSQPQPNMDDADAATDNDADFKSSTPANYSGIPGFVMHPQSIPRAMSSYTSDSLSVDGSIIEVAHSPITIGASFTTDTAHKTLGKPVKQYLLPDGSTSINGKGLGRGRPGIKRGPRKSKVSAEGSVEETASQSSQTPVQSQTPVESSTPTTNKRKRADSDINGKRAMSRSSMNSRESTPEYNPTISQTRSGRTTQKPVPIVVPASTNASPAFKRQHSASMTSTPILKTHPKIKRKIYRGKEQSALCEHCTRGFGPVGNVIVFCDACNKCWHQKCHSPQISKEVVADTSAEWFCATCDKILHGKKAKKVSTPAKPEAAILPPPPPPVQKYGLPLVGAEMLSLEQRRKYLSTLDKDRLIGIILRAGDLAPNMPIFETPLPLPIPPAQQPQPQFASNYVTPVTELPDLDKNGANDVLDEGYDDHFDEHAALYPKPGEGIQLPPDRVDLDMLLEGPDSRTFSHWVRGMPMKSVVDTYPLA